MEVKLCVVVSIVCCVGWWVADGSEDIYRPERCLASQLHYKDQLVLKDVASKLLVFLYIRCSVPTSCWCDGYDTLMLREQVFDKARCLSVDVDLVKRWSSCTLVISCNVRLQGPILFYMFHILPNRHSTLVLNAVSKYGCCDCLSEWILSILFLC